MSKFYVRKILSRIIMARNVLMNVYQIRTVFTIIMKVLVTCFHQPSRVTDYIFFFFYSRFLNSFMLILSLITHYIILPLIHSICSFNILFHLLHSIPLSIFPPKYLDFVWLLTMITIIINK